MEAEYISLHGCIRNTTSDAEDLQNISWERAGVSDHQKRIYRSIQHSVAEGRKGKRGESEQGQELLLIPTLGQLFGQRGSIWGYWSVQQLICESVNWVRATQTILPQAYVLYRDTSPLQIWCLGAGAKGLEKWDPKVRSAVDYGKMTHLEMREETAVGIPWRKAWQPWRQGDTTGVMCWGWSHCSL